MPRDAFCCRAHSGMLWPPGGLERCAAVDEQRLGGREPSLLGEGRSQPTPHLGDPPRRVMTFGGNVHFERLERLDKPSFGRSEFRLREQQISEVQGCRESR